MKKSNKKKRRNKNSGSFFQSQKFFVWIFFLISSLGIFYLNIINARFVQLCLRVVCIFLLNNSQFSVRQSTIMLLPSCCVHVCVSVSFLSGQIWYTQNVDHLFISPKTKCFQVCSIKMVEPSLTIPLNVVKVMSNLQSTCENE